MRDLDAKGITLSSVSITPYKRRYRHDVRDLLFHSYRMHSHLDWHETDQWLDSEEAPMRLAWAGNRLVGLMAASVPLNQSCWLRLLAVSDDIQPLPILTALWEDLLIELRAQSIHKVALLVLRDWIIHYAGALGFLYVEDIVTLRRNAQPMPDPTPTPVAIRTATSDDLAVITEIDQAAFIPPWQLTLSELRQATRIAAICTVALLNDEIVGYQLSTLYFDGAHLARLAVRPSMQGTGVGHVLVDDLLRRFVRRGVLSTTVNTQETNVRSQRLYNSFGFTRNGYDLPVWMADI
jgi:[ribosomal protein S18]-alanine N-acetyltransferase